MKTNQPQDQQSNGSKNSQQHDDVIDLVRQIFQTISKSKKIPPVIRGELAKLQDRYLKISMETPNLFRLKNHQTRVFLSAIVSISVEQHTKDAITDQYIKKIKSMVKTIVNLEQYDSQLFIKLQNDLEKFLQRQIKRTEIKKKRKDEKQKGLKKIIQAKKTSKQILQDKIANRKLPKFVNNILVDEWFNVLVLFNLRHDPQSDEYQDSLIFVDLLVELTHADSQSVLTKSQTVTLSDKYQKGLELVAFNSLDSKIKSKELITKINQLLNSRTPEKENRTEKELANKEKNLKENIVKPKDIIKLSSLTKLQKFSQITNKNETQATESVSGIETDSKTDTKHGSKIEIKTKIDYSKLMDSFKEGDWFEISTDKHKFIKAKLSWISPISGKYLFVDLNGLKITDKTETELIHSLQNQTIRMLNSKYGVSN